MLKARLDKTLSANIFNSTILLAMLCTNKMWATTKKDREWVRPRELSKDPCWEYPCVSKFEARLFGSEAE